MSVATRPWFSEGDTAFKGEEPFFFDTAQFPWVREVEAQWEVIRDELRQLLSSDVSSLQPYANREMTSGPNHWKTYGMMFWTIRSKDKCSKCPKTWQILKDIPGICAISFNLLEPGTTIKPHHGDTNAIIRCHMGLEVPAGAPRCAFRVGTETRSWEEGKLFMFCDAHEHTAWNNTDRKRYILVIDIMRPEYLAQRRSVAGQVLASIRLAVYYQRHRWLKRFLDNSFGHAVALACLRLAMAVPLRRSGV